jgi:hypothetical protein
MKYGRKARTYDPRIPRMSLVRAGLPAPPASVNYSTGMPASLGAMLNDQLGDCVEAAAGHAIQVWSFNGEGSMLTPPDSDIEAFYETAGGYVPGNPSTDNGTIIQTALADWLNDPIDGNELTAYVEIDVADMPNVKQSIYECGLCYIGFNVPSFLTNLETPGATWDVNPSADNTIIGGHCVDIVGYDASGNMTVISWGSLYTMTPAFFAQFVDEAYALANPDWISATGKSPAGLTISQLQSLMQEISSMSTVLVPGVATLAVASQPLPSGSAAQASISLVVTDAAGTVNPPVVLTGAENPPWSWAATYAAGQASAAETDLDVNGKTIATVGPWTFTVAAETPSTFEQGTGVSFVAASSSAKAAAQFKALSAAKK